jgi:hypothetical protein
MSPALTSASRSDSLRSVIRALEDEPHLVPNRDELSLGLGGHIVPVEKGSPLGPLEELEEKGIRVTDARMGDRTVQRPVQAKDLTE